MFFFYCQMYFLLHRHGILFCTGYSAVRWLFLCVFFSFFLAKYKHYIIIFKFFLLFSFFSSNSNINLFVRNVTSLHHTKVCCCCCFSCDFFFFYFFFDKKRLLANLSKFKFIMHIQFTLLCFLFLFCVMATMWCFSFK